MCDNMLNLITTTMPNMVDVLWPYLLECLEPAKYTHAIGVVCKVGAASSARLPPSVNSTCVHAQAITYLADTKRDAEEEDYYIDFDRQVNLPKPAAIIARCLVGGE